MSEESLVVEHVAADYAGAIVALEDVSLRVKRGEILALVGANGAGKTTLLRAIANLLPAVRGRVQRGQILFEREDVVRRSCADLVAAGLASVLEGRHCFAGLTIEENLITGALPRGLGRAAVKQDLARIYDLFPGLAPKRHLLASQVSGGEQQMTAIGRALMSRPKLLILDEPSMGLAPLVVRAIFETLARLNRETGLTILLAEQNVVMARRYAHRTVGLTAGITTSADTAAHEQLDGLYFGKRPANTLVGALASGQ